VRAQASGACLLAFFCSRRGPAALGVAATPASASLDDEVSAGRILAEQLHAGKASCTTLSDPHLDRLGESVMGRMAGSRAAHAAINRRMEQALRSENTDRMPELMRCERYATGSGIAGAVEPIARDDPRAEVGEQRHDHR
jgi:hypothetical protein